jgi:hypothetical protein
MATMQAMSWERYKKKKKEAKVESQTNPVSNDEMERNVNFLKKKQKNSTNQTLQSGSYEWDNWIKYNLENITRLNYKKKT